MNRRPKPDTVVKAQHINAVIVRARELCPFDVEGRLGALAFAFVVECKGAGLDKHEALRRLREAFNTPITTSAKLQEASEALTPEDRQAITPLLETNKPH